MFHSFAKLAASILDDPTFQGRVLGATNQSSNTFQIDAGNAAPNRLLVVAIGSVTSDFLPVISSVIIDGVAGTLDSGPFTSLSNAENRRTSSNIFSARGTPTSGVIDIDVTFTTNQNQMSAALHRLPGYSATPRDSNGLGPTSAVDFGSNINSFIDIEADGFVIGVAPWFDQGGDSPDLLGQGWSGGPTLNYTDTPNQRGITGASARFDNAASNQNIACAWDESIRTISLAIASYQLI